MEREKLPVIGSERLGAITTTWILQAPVEAGSEGL